MTKDDIIDCLRAMEQQLQEYDNQDARMRSLQHSIDNLKWKMQRNHVTLPAQPIFETPKSVGSGFSTKSACVVFVLSLCCFFNTLLIFRVRLNDFLLIVIVISAFLTAVFAGNIGKGRRRQKAEQRETERVAKINQRRIGEWEKQKHDIEEKNRKMDEQVREIEKQLPQLQKDYETAEQTKQQAWDKLSHLAQQIELHSDYWTPDTLTQIRSLLEHRRADTLKEALNRYEAEKIEREHLEKLENMYGKGLVISEKPL